MGFAPTLTPFIDSSNQLAPRVLVQFPTVASDTQYINVYRVSEGRQFQVRGGVKLFAVGGAFVMDSEVPFGVTATFQAEQFNSSDVSLGFTDTTSVSMYVTDSWITQPLNPTLGVRCQVMMDSANDFARPNPGSVVFTEGATVGRVIGGRRQGLVGMQLNVRLYSTDDADTFRQMLGDYQQDYPAVLCIRTPPPLRLPRLLFASTLDPHEVISGVNVMLVYKMTVTEVLPPAPGLVIPTLTRDDLDYAYATRAAMDAAYPSRIAQDSDYSKAGLAP